MALAPAVIVRAAAWPIEKLASFGDRELAARAAAAQSGDVTNWDGYRLEYERVLAAERAEVWKSTVGDPEFLKALTLTNPVLLDRAHQRDAGQLPLGRIRRLETTLFRYLARAVGRTEPCDLWAGVALASWSSSTRVRSQPPTYRFWPDLRPFQDILRALGARSAYRRSSAWRVNATLNRGADGAWAYWARLADGVVRRSLGPDPVADQLLPVIPHRPLGLVRLREELRARSSMSRSRLDALLEAYIDAGVIVGGLDLPARFSTPWEALSRAGSRLQLHDRRCWSEAVGTLSGNCSVLEQSLAELPVDEIARLLASSADTISGLADDLGLGTLNLPRVVLRCDLALPHHIELGPEIGRDVTAAVREYDEHADEISPGRAVRRASAARLRDALGSGRPLSKLADGDASLPARATGQTWEAIIRGVGLDPDVAHDPRAVVGIGLGGKPPETDVAAPLGCLMVALLERADGGATLVIRGAFDEVAPVYGRYAALWGRVGPQPRDPLFRWLRATLERVSRTCRLTIAELAGPCEANPNALAGPPLCSSVVELWGTTEDGLGLAGAAVFADPETGRPLVRLPSHKRPMALFSFAAADIARGDPISELLLRTSFREGPAANFQASALSLESELSASRPSPAVRIPGGAIVRPRRTILAGERLAQLAAAHGAERFATWQRLAREHDWPPLVRLRRDGEPPLLVRTSSPLAIEAVFESGSTRPQTLAVEELSGMPWLVDEEGCHFMVELAVPFTRSTHAWSTRTQEHERVEGR